MTYLTCGPGLPDFKPSKQRRLLFKGRLTHGPGFDEEIEWWVGRERSGKYQVLWLRSDWIDDPLLQVVAWMPVDDRSPKQTGTDLLCELWADEKRENFSDGPSHDVVDESDQALLNRNEVERLAQRIWPKG